MNKALKLVLIALAALLALLLAALAYVAATFDPNAHKPWLIERLREHTGRTLAIPGDIRMTLWPRIGAELGPVSLSEPNDATQIFAAAQQLRVSVAVLPLLARQVVIDQIRIDGLSLRIARDRQGRYNFADLLPATEPASPAPAAASGAAAASPLALDIGSIVLSNARIDYADAPSGRRLAVTALNLSTGAISAGRRARLELTGRLQGSAPALNLGFELQSGYTPRLQPLALELHELRASLDGALATLPAVQLQLSLPAAQASAQRLEAKALTLQARATPAGARAAHTLRLSTALQADLAAQRLTLDGLSLQGELALPQRSLALHAQGQAMADLARDALRLRLDGQIDGSTLALQSDIRLLTPPAVELDLKLGELDLDRYLPPPAPSQPAAPAAASASAADPAIDLGWLRAVNLRGRIDIAALKVAQLKASQLRLQLKLQDGRAELDPLQAALYGGQLQSALSASAGQPQRLAARLDLRQVQLGPLLQDLLDKQPLDGRGQVALDLRSSGQTLGQLKRGLDGKLALQLRDGAIRGFDIAAALRSAQARLSGAAQASAASAQEKTDFSELSATFRISQGVARNDDLSGKSPLLRLSGSGDIYLAEDRLDYTLKATIVPTLQGQGGPELERLRGLTVPVRIRGPYRDLGWSLDLGATALGSAREQLQQRQTELQQQTQRRLEEEKAKAQQRLQQEAEDKLKQLLRR